MVEAAAASLVAGHIVHVELVLTRLLKRIGRTRVDAAEGNIASEAWVILHVELIEVVRIVGVFAVFLASISVKFLNPHVLVARARAESRPLLSERILACANVSKFELTVSCIIRLVLDHFLWILLTDDVAARQGKLILVTDSGRASDGGGRDWNC